MFATVPYCQHYQWKFPLRTSQYRITDLLRIRRLEVVAQALSMGLIIISVYARPPGARGRNSVDLKSSDRDPQESIIVVGLGAAVARRE
jgi:hypothetical protein